MPSQSLRLCAIGIVLCFISYRVAAAGDVSIEHAQWVSLSSGGQQLSAVYLAPLKVYRGGIIIIQGDDIKDGEKPIVRALREGLPPKGWGTLGINIPDTSKGSGGASSATQQLNQAAMFLRNKGAPHVFVLLYSRGAADLLMHLAINNGAGTEGVVLLSGYSDDPNTYGALLKQNSSWRTPLFDMVGQFDYPIVESQVKLRARLFSNHQSLYRRVQVPGANHGYRRAEGSVIRSIYNWMTGRFTRRTSWFVLPRQ